MTARTPSVRDDDVASSCGGVDHLHQPRHHTHTHTAIKQPHAEHARNAARSSRDKHQLLMHHAHARVRAGFSVDDRFQSSLFGAAPELCRIDAGRWMQAGVRARVPALLHRITLQACRHYCVANKHSTARALWKAVKRRCAVLYYNSPVRFRVCHVNNPQLPDGQVMHHIFCIRSNGSHKTKYQFVSLLAHAFHAWSCCGGTVHM